MLPTSVRRGFGPAWQARTFGVLVAVVPAILLAGLLGVATMEDPPSVDVAAATTDVAAGPGGETTSTTLPDGAVVNADGTITASDGSVIAADGSVVSGPSTTGGGSGSTGGTAGPTGAAPGATGGAVPTGPATTRPAAPVALRATDQGVTKDTIKLGVIIPNLNELAQAGFRVGAPGDHRKIAEAWANHTNKRGGILGRKVILAFDVFSVLDVQDMLRSCKKMTDDEKVFTIINLGGYDSIGQLCIAKDKKVPLFAGDPQPAGWYDQAAPYLWTALMSKDRMHKNNVRLLKEIGTLKTGADIGVLYHNIPNVAPAVEQSLLPEMERQGVKPKIVIKLAEDSNQALNQIPQAVIDMQRSGVKQVFLMTNLIFKTSFIQQADKQTFRPTYFDNDHYFGCYDFTTTTYPDSYDGATCVTATNSGIAGPQSFDNPRLNQTFIKLADQVYLETFKSYADGGGDNADDQQAQRGLGFAFGTYFLQWKEAAERVGPELTRAKWGVEMGRTKAWDRTVTSPGLTYSATKHDGPDKIAIVRWTLAESNGYKAKKFRQTVDFRPAFY